jgi:hypothetical protein
VNEIVSLFLSRHSLLPLTRKPSVYNVRHLNVAVSPDNELFRDGTAAAAQSGTKGGHAERFCRENFI